MADPTTRTAVWDAQTIRKRLLEGVEPPKGLVQKAFRKLEEKLDAKHTHFFTHQGEVVGQVEVDDNKAQLLAAEKIMKLTPLYTPETKLGEQTPGIRIVFKDGVLAMEIGVAEPSAVEGGDYRIETSGEPVEQLNMESAHHEEPLALPDTTAESEVSTPVVEEPAYEIIKAHRQGPPPHVQRALGIIP